MLALAALDRLLAELPRDALWTSTAMTAALWLVAAGLVTWVTRPRLPPPGAVSEELGPGSLALANFLVHRGALTPTALSAVVLDLAARRVLAVEDIGDGRQLVRYFPQRSAGVALAPVEATVLELVRGRLGSGGTVPVGELSLGAEHTADRWWKRIEQDVLDEGRQLGMLRRRWPTGARVAMAAGLLVPAGLAALALESGDAVQRLAGDTSESSDLGGGTVVALLGWAAVLFFGDRRLRAWVTTAVGDHAAARWLGARSFFEGQPGLADAPPSAVVVRGRHLAAAVALGVAAVAAQRLPIGPQREDVAWVQRAGLWREVAIRYPASRRRTVGLELTVLWSALKVAACLLGLLGYVWFVRTIGAGLYDALRDSSGVPWPVVVGLSIVVLAIPTGWAVFAMAVGVAATRDLVFGFTDLGRVVEVVGPVVRAPAQVGEGRRVLTGFVAVDDGRSDELTALHLPHLGARPGQVVRVVATPRLGIVRHAEVLERPGAP